MMLKNAVVDAGTPGQVMPGYDYRHFCRGRPGTGTRVSPPWLLKSLSAK
jgi:hypothetical protein